MKKIATLFLLGISLVSFSQEKEKEKPKCFKDSLQCSKIDAKMYIGLGGQVQDLNIDKLLRVQGLAEVGSILPELTAGLNVFGEKFSGDVELGFTFAKPDKNGNETQYISYSARGRLHYNVVNKKSFAFTAGLNLAFTNSQLDIFSSSNVIDLNDLNPSNNSGHVSIKNKMFYVGPSAAVYLFKGYKFPFRLNAGYEFGLSRGRWNTDYGSVINSVNERNNNRFVFGITFL